MYSNYITYPDFVDNDLYTVLLIEPTVDEIADVAIVCKNVGTDFNVYIFNESKDEYSWLEEAFNRSDKVIINTSLSENSVIKDKLVSHVKALHYGPKRFFDNDRRINVPVEFFIEYVKLRIETPFDV
jgi:hypothetical protein